MSIVAIQRASIPTAPTHSLYDYRNELSNRIAQRAFSLVQGNGRIHGHGLENWLKESEFLTPVPLELSETDTELTVRAEVPGFTEKELEIIVEPGQPASVRCRRRSRQSDARRPTSCVPAREGESYAV